MGRFDADLITSFLRDFDLDALVLPECRLRSNTEAGQLARLHGFTIYSVLRGDSAGGAGKSSGGGVAVACPPGTHARVLATNPRGGIAV